MFRCTADSVVVGGGAAGFDDDSWEYDSYTADYAQANTDRKCVRVCVCVRACVCVFVCRMMDARAGNAGQGGSRKVRMENGEAWIRRAVMKDEMEDG